MLTYKKQVESIYMQTVGNGLKHIAFSAMHRGDGLSLILDSFVERNLDAGKQVLVLDFHESSPVSTNMSEKTLRGLDYINDIIIDEFSYDYLPVFQYAPLMNELREREKAQNLIDFLGDSYDVICMHLPPFDTQSFQPELIARVSEGLLLISLSGATYETELLEAKQRLERANAFMIGCVINDKQCPSLVSEMQREMNRLQKWTPSLVSKCNALFANSHFLNMKI